jgi:hypothetical protein
MGAGCAPAMTWAWHFCTEPTVWVVEAAISTAIMAMARLESSGIGSRLDRAWAHHPLLARGGIRVTGVVENSKQGARHHGIPRAIDSPQNRGAEQDRSGRKYGRLRSHECNALPIDIPG